MGTLFIGYSGGTIRLSDLMHGFVGATPAAPKVRSARSIASRQQRILNTFKLASLWSPIFDVPPEWIISITDIESSHDPNKVNMAAHSKGGAWGLMQQMADEAGEKLATIKRGFSEVPVVAATLKKWKGHPENLLDPMLNSMLGAWQLGMIRKNLGNTTDFKNIAAAYHQGLGAVRQRMKKGEPVVSRKTPAGLAYVAMATRAQNKFVPVLQAADPANTVLLALSQPGSSF
jgi:soluble lytic murein transglycosylase-like protein